MQNDIQSPETVILGVDTHLDVHVGACEALRIVGVARRSAIKARTQAINQLRALLVSAPQDVRDKLWKSKPHECVAACISSEASEYSPLRLALCCRPRSLAKRWVALTEELKELDGSLDKLTQKFVIAIIASVV